MRDERSPDRSSSDSVTLNFCKRHASWPGVSVCEKTDGGYNTDLFELEILSLQSFVLFDVVLGWFLLDAGRLVCRGRVLLGVELRGGHHDVSVGGGAHGSGGG